MANTAVSICSNALLMLGAAPIASFEDGDDKARLAANLWEPVRDEVLRAHTWNSCVKRVQLSPLADAPAYGFAKQYQLPGDWLRTIKVGQYADYPAEFRQEGRTLLANHSSLVLRYVYRNTNPGTYDSLLVSVLTKRLMWAFAYPVTKSTSLRAEARQEYLQALQHAKSIDSMEEPSEQVAEESPLITIRG